MSSEYENAIKGFDFYKLNSVDILLILLFILMSLGFFLFSSMGLDWRITRGAEGIIFHNGKQLHAVDMSTNGIFPLIRRQNDRGNQEWENPGGPIGLPSPNMR